MVDKHTQTRGHADLADVLSYRFHHGGKEFQGAERTMCKAMKSWWRDKHICRAKTVDLKDKCERVHSCVHSTALNGINWPWIAAMITKMRAWESQILRLTFRPHRMVDETWVTHKIRTSRFVGTCWKKMGLPLLTEKIASKFWTTVMWAVYDGDVPIMMALRSILGWRMTLWWRSRYSWE